MSGPGAPVIAKGHRPEEMLNHGVDLFTPYVYKEKEQGWYDRINDIGGTEIGEAQNKDGLWYKQHLDYGPGGRELAYLAGGIRKKFRNIPGTETLAGANAWLKTTGKDAQNWRAFEADITGKDDYPDGLKEILITDGKGRLKVVNGYALKSNDFPWRAAYYDTTDDATRANLNFSEWKRRATRINPELNKGQYAYSVDLGSANLVRPNITARQYFRKAIFAPTYKLFKEEIDTLKFNAMDKARLSSAICKTAYENLIVKPTLVKDFGKSPEEVKTMPQPVFKKLMGMKRVKEAIEAKLKKLVSSKSLVHQLFHMTAYQIIKQLFNFAHLEINPNKPIFNTTAEAIMKFKNQSELYGGVGALSRGSGTKIDEWNAGVEQEYQDAYKGKITERDNKRAAREAAHKRWEATKLAHGSDYDRSAAAWNQFYGLTQPEGVGDYMYSQEEAPLDSPAPEPTPEEILEAKINVFYETYKLNRTETLTEQLATFIKQEIPNREIRYYGTPEFFIEFKKWRITVIQKLYNDVLDSGEVLISKSKQKTFYTKLETFYYTYLDAPLKYEIVLALIKYIDQERPTIAKIQEPVFREGFLKYINQ